LPNPHEQAVVDQVLAVAAISELPAGSHLKAANFQRFCPSSGLFLTKARDGGLSDEAALGDLQRVIDLALSTLQRQPPQGDKPQSGQSADGQGQKPASKPEAPAAQPQAMALAEILQRLVSIEQRMAKYEGRPNDEANKPQEDKPEDKKPEGKPEEKPEGKPGEQREEMRYSVPGAQGPMTTEQLLALVKAGKVAGVKLAQTPDAPSARGKGGKPQQPGSAGSTPSGSPLRKEHPVVSSFQRNVEQLTGKPRQS